MTTTILSKRLSHQSLITLQILCGASFMLAATYIRIPLPFTPVPMTMQTLVALYLGLYLGKTKGTVAALIPFTLHPALLLGPTAGYILGFGVMAYITGYFCHHKKSSWPYCLAIAFVASAIQLLVGALWLSSFVGLSQTFALGILPFLGAGILKCLTFSVIRR